MELDSTQCIAALSTALGVEPARLRLRLEVPASARRPEYTALRHAVEVDGRAQYSVKWYPQEYHRSFNDILGTAQRLATDIGLRIPPFVARVAIDSFTGMVEEYIDAPSLQVLRERGLIDEPRVIAVLTGLFERCLAHPYPLQEQVERDRERCLEAIRWLGEGTALHRDLTHLIRDSDVLFASSAFLVQEDLVASNVLMVGSTEPVLIDYDHCRFTTMPWFAAWRASHAGALPRFFWRDSWDKPGLPLLFALCGALEIELQFSTLDPARFISDRDRNWSAQLASAGRALDTAVARAEAHAAEIQSLVIASGRLIEDAQQAAVARDYLATQFRVAFTEISGSLAGLASSQATTASYVERSVASLAEGQAAIRAIVDDAARQTRLTERLLGAALPSVSIVIVNYNGRRFLPRLFAALARQEYPNIEVVFVDNASSDGSADFAASLRPSTVIVRSRANLGFAAGNNLGVRHASGDYVVFLNNDTEPAPGWLAALVAAARSSPRVGAVGSKILFFPRFLQVSLATEPFRPVENGALEDPRELGVAFDCSSGTTGAGELKSIFVEGFHQAEFWAERTVRWTGPAATVFLPVVAGAEPVLRLTVRGHGSDDRRKLHVAVAGEHRLSHSLSSEFTTLDLPLSAADLGRAIDVINNAGSYQDEECNVGDRGFGRADDGAFEHEEIVSCLCGCSLLMRRDLFWRLGGYDERFFMYYEDADLCRRIRDSGYVLRYQPSSVVRHIHAGSSTEWSPFFTFFVTRNGLLMKIKHTPLPTALNTWRDLRARRRQVQARCRGSLPTFNLGALNSLPPFAVEYLALSQAEPIGLKILAQRLFWRALGVRRSQLRIRRPAHPVTKR